MEATARLLAPIPRWFLLSALLILFIPLATFFVNHSTVHRFILQHLKSQKGIEIGAVHVHIIPTLSIEVSDLLVRDARSAEPILRAPHASLSIRLWPLVTKQVAMLKLQTDEPELVIRRDRDGIWHVPLLDNDTTTPAAIDTADRAWSITGFLVRHGNLIVRDEDRLSEGVRLHNVEAAFESNPSQTQANVLLSGRSDDGGNFRITGSLALAKKDSSNAVVPVQFEGSFRFDHFDLAYWFERTGQSLTSLHNKMAWQGNMAANIHLDLLHGTQGFTVTVSDMNADLNWLVIRGQGTLQAGGTNHPAYALTLSTSPVSSQKLLEHVPASWIPEKVHAAVDEHDLKGVIELVSATLKGQSNVFREPDEWHVVANLIDGSGGWGKKPLMIQNLSATLSLDSKRAEVTHLAGDVEGVHITRSELTVFDLDLAPTVDAHLSGVGQLEHVLPVVQQLAGDTVDTGVLRRITNPTGTLHWGVHLTGPVSPELPLRVVNAELRVQDIGARVGSNLSVEHVNGSFAADSRFVRTTHLQGMVQGILFEAEGAVELESGAWNHDLKVHLSADGSAIQKLFEGFVPVTPHMLRGSAHAMIYLSGTAGVAHCRSTIDITGTEIVVPSFVHKRQGIPGRLEFEGNMLAGKRVIVDHFRMAVSDNEIHAAGQVELGPISKFHLQMKAGPLSLHALADLGIKTPITEGIFETSATLSGEGTNWRLWTPSGWISLRGGVVVLPALAKELTEVSGRVQITPRGALVDSFSFNIGESDVKLTGMIEDWRRHPRATFLVESSQLDVANFLLKRTGNDATKRGNLQEWMKSQEATISFLVKQFKYEQLVLRTVSGVIKVDQQKAALNELRGETPQGVLSGRLEARLWPSDRMDLDTEMSIDGIPAQAVLPAQEGATAALQGNLYLNGVLKATVDADTPIQHTLSTAYNGITIKVTKGRLYHDPVLTKVIEILNLPAVLIRQVDLSQGGIPFDSLSARVVAKDGLFSSNDILFDSPIIKVTGAGTADMKKNAMDLALAVSPLAAYSDLIGKIPLFGSLMGGDHQGLSTALFEAKGSLHDPQVSYLPIDSFRKGLTGYPRLAVDVLVNTLNLPHTAVAYAAQ